MLRFCFICFIAVLMSFTSSLAERKYAIYETSTGNKISVNDLAEKSSKFDIIFFGEFHDDTLIHAIQKEYLEAFYKKFKKTAISLEMFERDVQPVLNDYLKDKVTEEEFIKKSRPWPDFKIFYKPLTDFAKTNSLPVVAANIPRKYASVYSNDGMVGIEKLPANERGFVASSLNIKEDSYQKQFYHTMMQNFGLDSTAKLSPNQENTLFLYYGAQVLKDETMAESILDFYNANKDYKVIHYNGDFHSNNYLGTAQKVMERNSKLKVAVITPEYVEKGKNPDFDKSHKGGCDFLIVLEDMQHQPIQQSMMGGHLGENYLVNHKINIKLEPSKHFIEGSDNLKFKSPVIKKCSIKMLKDLKIESVSSPNGEIDYKIENIKDDTIYREIIISPKKGELIEISIKYKGNVYYSPNVTLLSQRHSNTPGIISDAKGEGIYLPGGSYFPQADKDLADFDITVTLPKDLKLITSGTVVSVKENGGNVTYNFKSEMPTDDMILVGGRYISIDTMYDGKKFSVYTFEKSGVADVYLKSSIEYYKYYTKLFGPYPYSGFTIVENFFASGFGMPGYTLLSNKLMAMPWIVLSPGSLAHEFVHNWWGNSIYVDRDLGNWCEALTTFSTNYYYNVLTKKPEQALDWRKKALLSLEALPEKSNYPLNKFKYQSNNDDAAIGYQKGAFVFYEFYKLLGEDRFFTALRNFAQKYKGKKAQWFGLIAAFSEQSKKDSLNLPMMKLMNQWLNDTKLPTLSLENVRTSGDSLFFEINQDLSCYMSVPIKFIDEKGFQVKFFTIKDKVNKFALKPDYKLKSLLLDPDYQCLRKLNKWEIPYSFGLTLGDNPLMVLPAKISPDYDVSLKFADMAQKSDYKVDFKSVEDLKDEDWANRSLIIVGDAKSNGFYRNLKGKFPDKVDIAGNSITVGNDVFTSDGNIGLLTMGHPKNKDKYVTVIYCQNMETPEQFRRLFHYLSYSMVVLGKAKSGRPLSQMEIFPAMKDRNLMRYEFVQ